jgi:hypothetical protein
MEQKLFEEKLSQVAEWHWERVQGCFTQNTRTKEIDANPPMYVHVDKIKTPPCPYGQEPLPKKNSDENKTEGCLFQIKVQEHLGEKVIVQRCYTCGGLRTPKGNFIPKPPHFRYAQLIVDADKKR